MTTFRDDEIRAKVNELYTYLVVRSEGNLSYLSLDYIHENNRNQVMGEQVMLKRILDWIEPLVDKS